MKVINIEVFISQHAFYIKILRFLPYLLKNKVRFSHNFQKKIGKNVHFTKKILIFLCILQKILRKILVQVKKIIYIYMLKTVQARKKLILTRFL